MAEQGVHADTGGGRPADRPAPGSADRPVVVIPARFSQSASALRYRAEVTARALVEAVYAAGGEPVVVHPSVDGADLDAAAHAVDAVGRRLRFADAVLLPGGGDLSPRWTETEEHPEHYDVDEEQDAFDLAVARWALAEGKPLLAICRGLQVVNTALGGTLHAHLEVETTGSSEHRHVVHEVDIEPGTPLADIAGGHVTEISCYHHQAIDRLAPGAAVWARAQDGTIEAVGLPECAGWFLGVQWHPEDTWATDPRQLAVFAAHVDAARR